MNVAGVHKIQICLIQCIFIEKTTNNNNTYYACHRKCCPCSWVTLPSSRCPML